jgi:hypothetical protein
VKRCNNWPSTIEPSKVLGNFAAIYNQNGIVYYRRDSIYTGLTVLSSSLEIWELGPLGPLGQLFKTHIGPEI